MFLSDLVPLGFIIAGMSHNIVAQVQEWLRAHEDDLLADYRKLLQIPSIESDPEPNAPFGAENRRALDYMLSLSASHGMSTKDGEGYYGFAEFGSGSQMVMSLGHVDVVPVGPGWKHEPFGAEVEDGWVYARGAVDDKGPTMAMFYASLAVKAVMGDPGVRVRNVFGCDEESGFGCVKHYLKTEEVPTIGVAPDAGWPCIHGEKGISDFVVSWPIPKGDLTLLSLEGGQRPNIVIDSAKAKVLASGAGKSILENAIAESWDRNLTFEWNGDELNITAVGKASHGANPFGGDNAVCRILRFLKDCAPTSQEREFDQMHELTHPGGNGIGIAGADEPSGPLTANLGIVETKDGHILFTINVRYPVTFVFDELKAKVEAKLADNVGKPTLVSASDSKPLYFPIDHPLIQTIQEVYEAETGDTKKPGTMGGGTYARAVPNCVAIGTGWAGDGPAHETDERYGVEHLFRASRIYGHLLVRMTQLAKEMP